MQGPIGLENFIPLAIARTYNIPVENGRVNSCGVRCKICATGIPKGLAHRVILRGEGLSHINDVYVCTPCFQPIKAAHETIERVKVERQW
jgi:hypothetical protein